MDFQDLIAFQIPLSMGISRQEYWSGITMPSSRGSLQPRDWTQISYVFCIGKWILYHYATWKPWLSEEALQISEKRRETKGKGEKERYTQLNAEFQRINSKER